MRVSEVESWLVINPESDKRNGRPVIQECGPLIEILPNSIIQLVHFSAKESVLLSLIPFTTQRDWRPELIYILSGIS